MNEVLSGLINIAAENYRLIRINDITAKLKAATVDEAAKADIMAMLEKVRQADTDISNELNQLIQKYNKTENIEAEKEDDEDIY